VAEVEVMTTLDEGEVTGVFVGVALDPPSEMAVVLQTAF
jgi:hypothetical protein